MSPTISAPLVIPALLNFLICRERGMLLSASGFDLDPIDNIGVSSSQFAPALILLREFNVDKTAFE